MQVLKGEIFLDRFFRHADIAETFINPSALTGQDMAKGNNNACVFEK